jgi:hypothetical protein
MIICVHKDTYINKTLISKQTIHNNTQAPPPPPLQQAHLQGLPKDGTRASSHSPTHTHNIIYTPASVVIATPDHSFPTLSTPLLQQQKPKMASSSKFVKVMQYVSLFPIAYLSLLAGA